jgi:hypothetical protein
VSHLPTGGIVIPLALPGRDEVDQATGRGASDRGQVIEKAREVAGSQIGGSRIEDAFGSKAIDVEKVAVELGHRANPRPGQRAAGSRPRGQSPIDIGANRVRDKSQAGKRAHKAEWAKARAGA